MRRRRTAATNRNPTIATTAASEITYATFAARCGAKAKRALAQSAGACQPVAKPSIGSGGPRSRSSPPRAAQ